MIFIVISIYIIDIVKYCLDSSSLRCKLPRDRLCPPQTAFNNHRCADNGAKVSLNDCRYSNDKGATELSATWSDPDFKPSDRAFYYARVLEDPTCRWSTYDALKAKVKPPDAYPPIIQDERGALRSGIRQWQRHKLHDEGTSSASKRRRNSFSTIGYTWTAPVAGRVN